MIQFGMEREEGILSVEVGEVLDLLEAVKANGKLMDSFGPKEKAANITEFKWKNMRYQEYTDKFFNEEVFRRGETASAGVHASAKGLAKIAAFMANGGSLDTGGIRHTLITKATWN